VKGEGFLFIIRTYFWIRDKHIGRVPIKNKYVLYIMLNFESVGSRIAKIIDETTKKTQIVYLSDPELDGDFGNGYTNIKL
jgi:hypothetical protein